MLRVTVEIWPGGDKAGGRAIAIANIANVTDLADVSDYEISVAENYNPINNTPPWSQRGRILRHDRRSSVWSLIAKLGIWAEEAAKTRG
jgi:hypothetical protein